MVYEAVQRFAAYNIGALAVTNAKGTVVGIVSERDYVSKVILVGDALWRHGLLDAIRSCSGALTPTNLRIDFVPEFLYPISVFMWRPFACPFHVYVLETAHSSEGDCDSTV